MKTFLFHIKNTSGVFTCKGWSQWEKLNYFLTQTNFIHFWISKKQLAKKLFERIKFYQNKRFHTTEPNHQI